MVSPGRYGVTSYEVTHSTGTESDCPLLPDRTKVCYIWCVAIVEIARDMDSLVASRLGMKWTGRCAAEFVRYRRYPTMDLGYNELNSQLAQAWPKFRSDAKSVLAWHENTCSPRNSVFRPNQFSRENLADKVKLSNNKRKKIYIYEVSFEYISFPSLSIDSLDQNAIQTHVKSQCLSLPPRKDGRSE